MHRVLGSMLAVVACAPTTSHLRVEDKVDMRHDEIGKPSSTNNEVTASTVGTDLVVKMIDHDVCPVTTYEEFHKIEHRTETVSTGVTVLEFVVGVALGGAGGFALVKPDNVETQLGTTADQTQKGGIAAASVGGLSLLFGIINTQRGGSSTKTLPADRRVVGEAHTAPCGDRPVKERALVLVAGTRTAPLTPTDANGNSTTSWDALSAALLEGASPPARAELHARDASGPTLSVVDLAPAREAAIARAWAGVTTARAAVAFRTRFPEAHRGDVDVKISTTGETEMDREVGAALDRNDLVGARHLLDEWAQLRPVKSDLRAAREATIAQRELEAKIVLLTTGIDAGLVIGEEPSDLGPLNRVVALTAELTAVAPTDSRTTAAQAKVLAARKARQKSLFDKANAAEKANMRPDAIKLSDLAVEAFADDPKAVPQRVDIHKRVARKYAADARAQMQQKDYSAAADSLSKAEAILKDDREVVYTRTKLTEQQAAVEAAIADASVRERKRAERLKQEEELKGAREAERQKQEAERLAREEDRKKKADEAKQQAEADRAAKVEEQKRKDEETRLARETEKQRQEADRAAKADAAKAEAERKRIEADAKKQAAAAEAESKRKAQLAEVERKKQAAAAQETARLKAEIDKKRQELAKQSAELDRQEAQLGIRHVSTAGPRVASVAPGPSSKSLVGVWTASGRFGPERMTLIFDAGANGGGVVSMLGSSGRLLGRQAITWQYNGGALVIDGGPRLAIRGGAKLRGEALDWGGFHWHRVRVHS